MCIKIYEVVALEYSQDMTNLCGLVGYIVGKFLANILRGRLHRYMLVKWCPKCCRLCCAVYIDLGTLFWVHSYVLFTLIAINNTT